MCLWLLYLWITLGSSIFSVKPSIFWSSFCHVYDCYLNGCLTDFFLSWHGIDIQDFLRKMSYVRSSLKEKYNQLLRERIGFTYVIFAVHLNQIKICHEKELDLRFIWSTFQPYDIKFVRSTVLTLKTSRVIIS